MNKSLRNSKEKEKGYSFLSFAQLKQLPVQDGSVLFCFPMIKNSVAQTFY